MYILFYNIFYSINNTIQKKAFLNSLINYIYIFKNKVFLYYWYIFFENIKNY